MRSRPVGVGVDWVRLVVVGSAALLDGTSTMKIRRALIRDAERALDIWWDAKSEIGLNPSKPQQEYIEVWRGYCRSGDVWAAEVDGEIAAFIYLLAMEIFYIVTARDHRQKGLARALIAQAKKLAHRRGYAALTARTRDINTATQTLLENQGFIEAEGNPDPDQTWRYYIWKTE